MTNMTTLQCW